MAWFAAGDGEPEWSVLRWVPLSPRASAQIRSLVAVNVLVACFLELLWSLLGARVAWRGIKAADLGQAASGPAPCPATTAASSVVAVEKEAPVAAGVALERGAGDGKVDVDADSERGSGHSGVFGATCELKQEKASRSSRRAERRAEEASRRKQQKDAASLQRRRRAPELPPSMSNSPPPCPSPLAELSLEQRTMNLEERVARFLDRSQVGQDLVQDAQDQDRGEGSNLQPVSS